MDFKDFKSSCRALTTSEVGSIPTRSRHIVDLRRGWGRAALLGVLLLVATRPAAAEGPPAGTIRAPVVTRPGLPGPSPAATLLRSIAFPGWGQLENDKPLKAALVFTVETGLLTGGFVEYERAQRSRDDEREAVIQGDEQGAARAYQRYLDRRDRAVSRFWWAGFTLMLSMIDAYTDAHFRDFVKAAVPEITSEDVETPPPPPASPAPSPAPPEPSAPKPELGLDVTGERLGLALRF